MGNQAMTSKVAQMVKNLPAVQETWVRFLGQEDPLEKGKAPRSRILAGKSNGQRSLVGYSTWGHKESDMTEELTLLHFHPMNGGSLPARQSNATFDVLLSALPSSLMR